jgi:ribosome-associated toxin RatA of RatAB toxin-antitoxin module
VAGGACRHHARVATGTCHFPTTGPSEPRNALAQLLVPSAELLSDTAPDRLSAEVMPLVFPSAPPEVAASCSLDTIQQEMERLPHGTRRLAVQLRLPVDPQWLWAVLTDYENLDRFIPNLASSRQLWRRGAQVAVEQVGVQTFCGMRFSARVQLVLTEERQQGRLVFEMLEGDFRCFQGAWQVGLDAAGSWLLYELTVQGKPGMPIGLIEQRLQHDLACNVRGVQQEARRRASLTA